MGKPLFENQAAYEALGRLLDIARRYTGQSRRVADFLLAWHNAESNRYPGDIGFAKEMQTVWQTWRSGGKASPS
jgi:hypothetical protein